MPNSGPPSWLGQHPPVRAFGQAPSSIELGGLLGTQRPHRVALPHASSGDECGEHTNLDRWTDGAGKSAPEGRNACGSIGAERRHRVSPTGATGRQVGREQRRRAEHQRGTDKRCEIGGLSAH
jgi:hypothetical protein